MKYGGSLVSAVGITNGGFLGLNELPSRELGAVMDCAPTTCALAVITDSIVASPELLVNENNCQKNH